MFTNICDYTETLQIRNRQDSGLFLETRFFSNVSPYSQALPEIQQDYFYLHQTDQLLHYSWLILSSTGLSVTIDQEVLLLRIKKMKKNAT